MKDSMGSSVICKVEIFKVEIYHQETIKNIDIAYQLSRKGTVQPLIVLSYSIIHFYLGISNVILEANDIEMNPGTTSVNKCKHNPALNITKPYAQLPV